MSSKKAGKKSKKKKSQSGEQSGASTKRAARFFAAAAVGDHGAIERLLEGGLDANAMSQMPVLEEEKMQNVLLNILHQETFLNVKQDNACMFY